MRRDPGAELHGEHLCAQANSQKRPLLPQRNRNPVDFPADEFRAAHPAGKIFIAWIGGGRGHAVVASHRAYRRPA